MTTASNETTAPVEVATEVAAPEVVVEQETQVEQPDYSYVPKKFLSDGKPDWENLSKSYQSLEKKLGAKGILVPEDITEYTFEGVEVALDEERVNEFKTEAQKAGLSKEQYAFVMGKYNEMMSANGLNASASEAVLKQEWGAEFDKNLSLARKAFDEFAPSDLTIEDPILNHPTVLKLLASLGRELGEDTQKTVKGSTSARGITQDDIMEIQKSSDYWDNPTKQAQVRQWYEKRYK